MASLLLRSAGRVLRRSLPQGPFRRTPAQPFVDNPRLFSSDGVNKHSCKLEKGLPQHIESRLASIEANVAADFHSWRAIREQVEVILQKIIENQLAEKKHDRVVLCAFGVLGLALCAGEALFGGVKEKSGAVKPLI